MKRLTSFAECSSHIVAPLDIQADTIANVAGLLHLATEVDRTTTDEMLLAGPTTLRRENSALWVAALGEGSERYTLALRAQMHVDTDPTDLSSAHTLSLGVTHNRSHLQSQFAIHPEGAQGVRLAAAEASQSMDADSLLEVAGKRSALGLVVMLASLAQQQPTATTRSMELWTPGGVHVKAGVEMAPATGFGPVTRHKLAIAEDYRPATGRGRSVLDSQVAFRAESSYPVHAEQSFANGGGQIIKGNVRKARLDYALDMAFSEVEQFAEAYAAANPRK